MRTLRQQWQEGEATLGGWISVPDPIVAEALARSGFDYVCVDNQHGAIDYSATVTILGACVAAGTSTIVRVPWNEPGIIGKMLDAGAHGIIIPMVNSPEEAEAAVQACRYAPRGSRSYGPTVVGQRVADYPNWAADNVAVIPMIETRQAVEAIDDILAVEGIDAVYVGPADLSLTLGLPPGNNDGEPSFDDAYAKIVDACERAGVVAGCHATGTLAPVRLAAGFRMVTVASDLLAMWRGASIELGLARGDGGESRPDRIY